MLINYHRRHKKNSGDMLSSPLNYFQFSTEVELAEIMDPEVKAGDILIGGGGLLAQNQIMQGVSTLLENKQGKAIGWGIGHNMHVYPIYSSINYTGVNRWRTMVKGQLASLGLISVSLRDLAIDFSAIQPVMDQFDLIGIRDYGYGYPWVPCASCMHPALDQFRDSPITQEVIVYEHPMFMRLDICQYPKQGNLGTDFEHVLAFLSSAETIITSSYHGAYWGILLGRKVICVPWSTKFMGFKYPVPICQDLLNLRQCLRQAKAFPEALQECRQVNIDFSHQVADLLNLNVTAQFCDVTEIDRIPCV
jgi:hypothetical protein